MRLYHFLCGAWLVALSVLALEPGRSRFAPRSPKYTIPNVGKVSGEEWLSVFHDLQSAQAKVDRASKNGNLPAAHRAQKEHDAAKDRYFKVAARSGLPPAELKAAIRKQGFLPPMYMKELDSLHPTKGQKRQKFMRFFGIGVQKKKKGPGKDPKKKKGPKK